MIECGSPSLPLCPVGWSWVPTTRSFALSSVSEMLSVMRWLLGAQTPAVTSKGGGLPVLVPRWGVPPSCQFGYWRDTWGCGEVSSWLLSPLVECDLVDPRGMERVLNVTRGLGWGPRL